DHWLRRVGLRGNVCQAVMKLGPGVQAERLRQHIANSPALNWLARLRILRPLPVVAPFWRAKSRPPVFFHEHRDERPEEAGSDLVPKAVPEHDLNAGRGPAFSVDLVHHPDKSSDLVFSWNHALLDARGADLVLHHLGEDKATNGGSILEHLINPKQRG